MALLDADGAMAGSLIAAAMETAGMGIQAEILEWMQGDGMMLAGLLYLIAIISAVFAVAVGGQYLWGRYLLIGPAVFLFLIQITDDVNGSKWNFADHRFDESNVSRALEGTGFDGVGDVSLFFKMWNNFMSDVTQELMTLLNLTQDGSHLDFLTKIERYMNLWLYPKIPDANMQRFIRLIMINQCADYYMKQMSIASPHVDQVEKTEYIRQITQAEPDVVFELKDNYTREENELHWWMINEAGFAPGGYTCQGLWDAAVKAMEGQTAADIVRTLSTNLNVDQELEQVNITMLEKIGIQTGRANEQVILEQGQFLQAVHWVLARSMWNEFTNTNKYNEYFNQEAHGGFFASSVPNGAFPVQNSGTNVNSSVRQFNRTETYQFKGDFVNAALALPHFQGVTLLLLAATYPFFALAVVLPGRAGSILMWMGLWAWVKLWDLGFAVVMMIDNILYVMFPRGPGLAAGDINNAGRAWVKVMEIDPAYSSAMYYNIIAVCMYAVPIATGVFVKGAGGAFVGMVGDAWKAHSTRLAGSGFSFARALQGQSYVANQRRREFDAVGQALTDIASSPSVQKDFLDFMALNAGRDGVKIGNAELSKFLKERFSKIDGVGAAGAAGKALDAKLSAMSDQKKEAIMTAIDAYASLKEYQYSAGPAGWWTAESARVAGYYSHDTATSYPGGKLLAATLAKSYLKQEPIQRGRVDPWAKYLFGLVPGGSSKK